MSSASAILAPAHAGVNRLGAALDRPRHPPGPGPTTACCRVLSLPVQASTALHITRSGRPHFAIQPASQQVAVPQPVTRTEARRSWSSPPAPGWSGASTPCLSKWPGAIAPPHPRYPRLPFCGPGLHRAGVSRFGDVALIAQGARHEIDRGIDGTVQVLDARLDAARSCSAIPQCWCQSIGEVPSLTRS